MGGGAFHRSAAEGRQAQSIDLSEANSARIQDLLTEATRTWSDRLLGSVQTGAIEAGIAEHYADALPEEYKQVVKPSEAIADIAIIEGLQADSVCCRWSPATRRRRRGEAYLTWYLAVRRR